MGKGGGNTQQQVYQTSVPEYAEPFMLDILNRGQAESLKEYTPYGGERIAGFTPEQIRIQQETAGLTTPGQFQTATDFATTAGLGALEASRYAPSQFNIERVTAPELTQYQMSPYEKVQGGQYTAPTMATAQTEYAPQLERFQMNAPDQFGAAQAQQYMSPYQQAVTDLTKREAGLEAARAQRMADLAAGKRGALGSSGDILGRAERERALMGRLTDIQTKGSEAAFQQAQQQFERDRAAQMTAQRENLQAALGVQQLGTQTGLQTALANLSAEQQANVQNQAAQLQTQGLTADQALRAALANQQAGLTTAQQDLAARLQTQQLGTQTGLQAALANQQYGLQAQQLAEQSKQFGANLGMQGYQQLGQMGQLLGSLGTAEQTANLQRLAQQGSTAAQQQLLQQQKLDQAYQDWMARQGYNQQQIGFMSNLLRGLPIGQTSTTSAPAPSIASQLMGLGTAGYGLSRMGGFAKGGLAGLTMYHLAGDKE